MEAPFSTSGEQRSIAATITNFQLNSLHLQKGKKGNKY
jgi:hypothetical protein